MTAATENGTFSTWSESACWTSSFDERMPAPKMRSPSSCSMSPNSTVNQWSRSSDWRSVPSAWSALLPNRW